MTGPARAASLTPVTARAALVAAALLVGAVAAGRADLVVLAVPFVLGPLLLGQLLPGSGGRPRVRLELRPHAPTLSEQAPAAALVTLRSEADVDAAVVRVPPWGGSSPPPAQVVALRAGEPVTVAVRVATPRWGRHALGPAQVVALGPGLAVQGRAASPGPVAVTVLPEVAPFSAADHALPPRLRVGNHRSRRQGPGVEPVAVRPYAVGDRLRQVDWRTTSRTGELHVRATVTERATDVVVLVDALADPGPPGGSVLDTAVRAAAGIVGHYLAYGDSVGLVQFGGRLRTLPSGAGRAQLLRAREWLLDVRLPLNVFAAERSELWSPTPRQTPALVVALTPLLDERTAVLLATLRRRGAMVVAVDVLPQASVPVPTADEAGLAARLWTLERDSTIGRLGELGVPVVAWRGAESLDETLATVVRMGAAPHAALR